MAASNLGVAANKNPFRIDGKVALVTGGGQGIGEAAAHILAQAGAKVILVGRNEVRLNSVASEINHFGKAEYITAELSSKKEIIVLVEEITRRNFEIDILVNNAAIGQWKPATEITADEWDLMIRTNLSSVFWLSQKLGAKMIARKYGKIINISSISGIIVNSEHPHVHYGSSKAGVIHLTKSLAAEWAKFGVRVNCITPGYTSTKMLTDLLATPEGKHIGRRIKELTPMGEMATPEDIGNGILYFASPASDYVTGQILSIDGGYTLW